MELVEEFIFTFLVLHQKLKVEVNMGFQDHNVDQIIFNMKEFHLGSTNATPVRILVTCMLINTFMTEGALTRR